MNCPTRLWIWLTVLALPGVVCTEVVCTEAVGQQGIPAGANPAKAQYRKLAPGVLKTVDSGRRLEESFSRHDVVELLAEDPKFDWARDGSFRHKVYSLELKFKPMRMIQVDVPQPDGYMKPTMIWYMVFSVTNRKIEEKTCSLEFNAAEGRFEQRVTVEGAAAGQAVQSPPQYGWMQPLPAQEGKYRVRFANGPIRFIPEFLLESPDLSRPEPDRVIPVAVGTPAVKGPIWLREDPNRRFFTTVEICEQVIPPGETIWGIVTWDGSRPGMQQIDRFSISIQGLTNAYLWMDTPGTYKKGDPIGTGRTLARKTLMLNFWRPGDEYYENEREIRYGIPLEVDYQWVYRYKGKSASWVYLQQDAGGKWVHLYKKDWVWRYRDDSDPRWIHLYKDHRGDWVYWYQDHGDTFWRTRGKRRDGALIYLYQDHDAGWVYVYKDKDGNWRELVEGVDGKVFDKSVPRLRRRVPLSPRPPREGAG